MYNIIVFGCPNDTDVYINICFTLYLIRIGKKYANFTFRQSG